MSRKAELLRLKDSEEVFEGLEHKVNTVCTSEKMEGGSDRIREGGKLFERKVERERESKVKAKSFPGLYWILGGVQS